MNPMTVDEEYKLFLEHVSRRRARKRYTDAVILGLALVDIGSRRASIKAQGVGWVCGTPNQRLTEHIARKLTALYGEEKLHDYVESCCCDPEAEAEQDAFWPELMEHIPQIGIIRF